MSALGIRALTEGWVRIPYKFFFDHMHRGLPTPTVQHETKSFLWIRRDDPAIGELISDAKHYAHRWGPDEMPPGLKSAAKALLKALGEKA